MNRADLHALDSRDRLLMVHARMLLLGCKARAPKCALTDPDEIWDAIGELAAAIEVITKTQLEKTP
jgi:hypothetical protein